MISSTLFYTLAFNLLFFIQELFLVLPKALTPNLSPILYHNNHSWTGENRLAFLFQRNGRRGDSADWLSISLVAQQATSPDHRWPLFSELGGLSWIFRILAASSGGRFFAAERRGNDHGLSAVQPPNDVLSCTDCTRHHHHDRYLAKRPSSFAIR